MTALPAFPPLWQRGACPLLSLDGEAGHALPQLNALLDEHGALLLRGYGVASPEALARARASLGADAMAYVEGNSPRSKLSAENVYTSTEYPAEAFISLHNELSYAASWPARLYFCCVTPAETGGHTLLASSAAIHDGLPPEVRDAFARHGVLYIRNLHGGDGFGFGPSWQSTFETDRRADVDAWCAANGIEQEWRDGNTLRLITRRPAIATHPATGRRVWFNQADQFHPSTNSPDVLEALTEIFGEDPFSFPQYACLGDGRAIDDGMLARIREVTERHTVRFDWQAGDCLVIDNMLMSHGRSPFTGARRILVSMSR
ncbi:TauD/TfdA family dioxygenase [Burkholderia gladioli]|uniref:TauD/TfdA family dioxygenase n=1 Tax=Burkholderia gladioli TaxID=28095 RepID=UPI00163FBC71|nr:TauD/TfdA family dioxygenase [Burkholderia gladioli]